MSWQQVDLAPPLPPEVQAILADLTVAGNSVATTLGIISDALDIVKIYYQAGSDLFKAIMSALVTELENLMNDLFGAGVFELFVTPFNVNRRGLTIDKLGIPKVTPAQAINFAVNSFDDTGDEQRPIFSDGANVAAFGLLITAPDIILFYEILKKLGVFWKTKEFEILIQRVELAQNPKTRSFNPDWSSFKFNQIEYIGQLQKDMGETLALIKGYMLVADDVMTKLIDALQKKIDDLNARIVALQAIVDLIGSLDEMAGVWFLNVPLGPGGTALIKKELKDQVLSGLSFNNYTMMALYMGGGPNAQAAETWRALLA